METGVLEQIAGSVERELAEQSLPSLAVAAACDGEIVWEQAFGWADRENRVPATPHTLYSLASISKPITTTALMTLVQQGKIDLDKPANQYLGDAKLKAMAGSAEGATVRRIANHMSGLPLHYQFFYAEEPYSRPAMDETIRRYGHLVRIPGERFQYSNLGYGVLDYIISRVSGESYRDYMRKAVFHPLGMHQSSVDLTPELAPHQAVRYGSDAVRYPHYDFDHPGGSAIYASVHDLVRFGMLHAGCTLSDQRQILTADSIAEMQVQTSAPEESTGYGVGWRCETDCEGVRIISHNGGMGGVSTTLLIVPQHRVVVAALCNAAAGLPHRAAEELIAALLPDLGARRKKAKEAAKEAEQAEREARNKKKAAFRPGKELNGHWKGAIETYNGSVPVVLQFKSSGDVHLQMGNQLKMLVNDVEFREEDLKGVFAGDIGTDDANRRPYRLHLDMRLRGDTLTGCVIAVTHLEHGEGGAPDKVSRIN